MGRDSHASEIFCDAGASSISRMRIHDLRHALSAWLALDDKSSGRPRSLWAMHILPTPMTLIITFFLSLGGLSSAELVGQWEVDRSWSVHPSAHPVLVTAGESQYLAYYNAERRLTLAWRRLGDADWEHRHFPVVTRWAARAHAQISLAVDRDGHIHLACYRRDLSESPASPPHAIYYRSERPHDVASMERSVLGSPDAPNPHYPYFFSDADGGMFFRFREGGSGRGNQHIFRYDIEARTWHATPMLHDGKGRMSPYGGPQLGPDGRWHCLWMWRDTPDAATNHTLSYMVSPDLENWHAACGAELALPVSAQQPKVIVEPAKPGEGLLNPHQWLGFDSEQRPVASYHLYAPCGNSAIQVARFEDGAWKREVAHLWDFRWQFGGRGVIHIALRAGPVRPIGDQRLALDVWSEHAGNQRVILDEATLRPVSIGPRGLEDEATVAWRRPFKSAEIDFPERPMHVHWLPGLGQAGEAGVRYEVRWETGPTNLGDLPVPKPWPDAAPLRVFKLRTTNS